MRGGTLVASSLAILSCGGGGSASHGTTQPIAKHISVRVDNSPAPAEAAQAAPPPVAPRISVTPGDVVNPPAVPSPETAPTVPPDKTVEMREAGRTALGIQNGRGISIRSYPHGWAWLHDGAIVRTASTKTGLVVYFRGRSDDPYLVQTAGNSYVFQAGRLVRMFDEQGQPRRPTSHAAQVAQQQLAIARAQYATAVQAMRRR